MADPTSRTPNTAMVLLDGKEEPNAQVLTVVEAYESCEKNSATFVIESVGSRRMERLETVSIAENIQNKLCEVFVAENRIHYGKVVRSLTRIDGDSVSFTSRFDSHLWAPPRIDHEEQLYPEKYGRALFAGTEDELVFNPVIDGRAIPNMWNDFEYAFDIPPDDRSKSKYPAFMRAVSLPMRAFDPVDPDPKLDKLQFWSVLDIVVYLTNRMNPKEAYVRNPNHFVLGRRLGSIVKDRQLVRGFKFSTDESLDQIFNRLLIPLGLRWRISPKGGARVARTGLPADLEISFSRGSSGKTLTRKRAWSGVKVDQVSDLNLSTDHVDSSANDIFVLGDWYHTESTFELMPAWDPSYDNHLASDLTEAQIEASGNPALHRVWRDWVLNEGGDYIGVRGEDDSYYDQGKEPYDFKPIFGYKAKPIRRKFLPTLTQSPELQNDPWGTWKGVYVEYWSDSNAEWRHISTLGDGATIRPLDNECGIRFTNPSSPPARLISEGLSRVKIRVTATVREDARLFGRSRAGAGKTFLKDPLPRVVEAKEYTLKKIHKDSIFYDLVDGGSLKSVARNDSDAIADYSNTLFNEWNRSTMQGSIVFHGIDAKTDFFFNWIQGITPIGVSFRTTARLVRPRRYVTTSGVKYDFTNQTTEHFISTGPRRTK